MAMAMVIIMCLQKYWEILKSQFLTKYTDSTAQCPMITVLHSHPTTAQCPMTTVLHSHPGPLVSCDTIVSVCLSSVVTSLSLCGWWGRNNERSEECEESFGWSLCVSLQKITHTTCGSYKSYSNCPINNAWNHVKNHILNIISHTCHLLFEIECIEYDDSWSTCHVMSTFHLHSWMDCGLVGDEMRIRRCCGALQIQQHIITSIFIFHCNFYSFIISSFSCLLYSSLTLFIACLIS